MLTFLGEHRTKILGAATALLSAILSMVATGQFDGLLEPTTERWLAIFCSLLATVLGGGTVAVGFSNTTKERVANAQAVVAQAIMGTTTSEQADRRIE